MILSIGERVALLGILPEQGNFVTLKIVRKLREALSFSEDEIKQIDLRQTGQQIFWNPLADPMKDVEIGEKATDVVVDSLRLMDNQEKLTTQHVDVYEKFIGA